MEKFVISNSKLKEQTGKVFGLPSQGMFSAQKEGGAGMNRWQKGQLKRFREHEPGEDDKYDDVGEFSASLQYVRRLTLS